MFKPFLKYVTHQEAKHLLDDLGFQLRNENTEFYYTFTFGKNGGVEYVVGKNNG